MSSSSLISITSNASKISRDLLKAKKLAIKDVSDQLTAIIWREFATLVRQTPQYSGTTAASWNIVMGGRSKAGVGDGVRALPKPLSASEAFRMGHQAAVNVALKENEGALDNFLEDNRSKDIVVFNDAPGAEPSEEGTFLRDVNKAGAKMTSRFEARLKVRLAQGIKTKNQKV